MPDFVDKKLEEWGVKHLGGKFMFEPMWLDAKQELKAFIAEENRKSCIDELEYLLDAQDQETDLDGRPTTWPYHIISGDGERFLIEQRLAVLKDNKEIKK